MKASTPIFTHTQHPMLMFFMPPGWLVVVSLFTTIFYVGLNFILPELSMIIAGGFGIVAFIVLKIKMGDDRHSDQVFRTGLAWRLAHRSGRLTSGGRNV